MICTQDIDRQYYPEIGSRDVEGCRERQFAINFIGWLAGEVLNLFEKPIKLIAILCIWWPVNLCG